MDREEDWRVPEQARGPVRGALYGDRVLGGTDGWEYTNHNRMKAD